MRKLILTCVMTMSSISMAHDEGHGPKLTDAGKYGGVITAVVLKSDATKGSKAQLQYKSELVRSSDSSVRIYLYDNEMKSADPKGFDLKASAVMWSGKGQKTKSEFALEQKEGAFVGKMPKPASAPYTIDVTFKKDGKEYLSGFENLD